MLSSVLHFFTRCHIKSELQPLQPACTQHRNVLMFLTCAAAALICIVMKHINKFHSAASTNAVQQQPDNTHQVCFSNHNVLNNHVSSASDAQLTFVCVYQGFIQKRDFHMCVVLFKHPQEHLLNLKYRDKQKPKNLKIFDM